MRKTHIIALCTVMLLNLVLALTLNGIGFAASLENRVNCPQDVENASSAPPNLLTVKPSSSLHATLILADAQAKDSKLQIVLCVSSLLPLDPDEVTIEWLAGITQTNQVHFDQRRYGANPIEIPYSIHVDNKAISATLSVYVHGQLADGTIVGDLVSKQLTPPTTARNQGGATPNQIWMLKDAQALPIPAEAPAERVNNAPSTPQPGPTLPCALSNQQANSTNNAQANGGVPDNAQEYTVTVKGRWVDRNGKPIPNALVEIWDDDSPPSYWDEYLGCAYTDVKGVFEKEVPGSEPWGAGELDIYVKFHTIVPVGGNAVFKVTPENDGCLNTLSYCAKTDTLNNVTREVNIGTYQPPEEHKDVWYIYDLILNQAYLYLRNKVEWQFSKSLQIIWPVKLPKTTGYDANYQKLYLQQDDGWPDSDVILHEFSHFVMHTVYGYVPDVNPDDIQNSDDPKSCKKHFWNGESNPVCAWVEGWAHFLQAAIQVAPNDSAHADYQDLLPGNKIYLQASLESPGTTGSTVEGAVAASLWDIYDICADEGDFLDPLYHGINGDQNHSGIWFVFWNHPNTTVEFLDNWSCGVSYSEVKTIFAHYQLNKNFDNNNCSARASSNAASETILPSNKPTIAETNVNGQEAVLPGRVFLPLTANQCVRLDAISR